VPLFGRACESSGRESVAEKRCSWLASRNWVCVCGGRDCDFERNWEAIDDAEVEL